MAKKKSASQEFDNSIIDEIWDDPRVSENKSLADSIETSINQRVAAFLERAGLDDEVVNNMSIVETQVFLYKAILHIGMLAEEPSLALECFRRASEVAALADSIMPV